MPHEIRILLGQASPLQRAGRWQDAIELYAEVFRSSLKERDPEHVLEAVLLIGFCYRALGDRELTIEHLELALTIAQLRSDASTAGRSLNGLATFHHVHGELELAEQFYQGARTFALEANNLLTVGHIDQNLGALHNVRGDLSHALEAYQSALNSYRHGGQTRELPGVLNNLGMLHIDRSEFEAASHCLQEALYLCRKDQDLVTEAIVEINRTELFLAQGNVDEARRSCDSAFEIFSEHGENSGRAEALKFYGIIYRETSKLHLAEIHLREAVEVASRYQFPLEEAEAHRELSRLLRMQSRNQEALQSLNRAHELFASLRAKNDTADIHRRLDNLQDEFLSLVIAWGESIEAKDRYTSGHCRRVAGYASKIAEHLGLSERDLTWFRMGAFLHDIGKTEMPGDILNKPGPLTDEERTLIESHTIVGDEILAPIPFPWDIRPMVRSHHERWDGRGYPDGLFGSQIPLSARILRIADVFDALTTNRSYRKPLTPDQALQLMQDDDGAFDPDLFDLFRKLVPTFALMLSLEPELEHQES